MTTETQSVTAVLLGEHAAIGAVLDSLDRAVDALAEGRPVDPTIFEDMLRFARLFVGQCHHGKEEQILFPLVRHASGTTATVIGQLEQEHAQGTELVDAFARAVAGYTGAGLPAAGPLVRAARAYATYLRRHMQFENEQFLAHVQEDASSSDLDAALASFERFEDEVMGTGTHEELHRMIDTLGPRIAAYTA